MQQERTPEEIIKSVIPSGIQNVKGKGDGKPQYKAELEAIKKCMIEYTNDFRAKYEQEKSLRIAADVVIDSFSGGELDTEAYTHYQQLKTT